MSPLPGIGQIIVVSLICLKLHRNVAVATVVRYNKLSHSTPSCKTTSYVFGEPFPYIEKSVIIHKLGFSDDPYDERRFDEGSDCACSHLTCHRRQSEFCIPKDVSDDYESRTRKSYPDMNPYLQPVGVIFPIDMEQRTEQQVLKQLALMIRTCYPWLAVLCSFYEDRQDPAGPRSSSSTPGLFPWLRECCDAVILPSRRFTLLDSTQVIHRQEDDTRQNLIFTLANWKYVCNKCGVTRILRPEDLVTPRDYRRSQTTPSGKRIPIAARHRDAYLHLAPMNPPRHGRLNVTGGFESTMIKYLSQPNALNFSYFYTGDINRWDTGGASLTNGTYNGMLDLLSRRKAILAVSNQKPFTPATALFTFTDCYDVDTLPFASRIEIRPVTIDRLFKSFGQDCINLLVASTVCFGAVAHLLLGVRRLYVRDLLALVWYFAMRLFQNGFSMAILDPARTPPQVKWMVFMWGILALVFNSMFNGVWVTFTTTPPFKGVFDDFKKMKDYIVRENSTAYMSPGMMRSSHIYGETSKVIFDHGQANSDPIDIIAHLRLDRMLSFWLYDRIYLTYELNHHDPNGTIHISSEYFIIQQQCWVAQKNCAIESHISLALVLFRESGLFLQLKKNSGVLNLPPRTPDDPFKPVSLAQLREMMLLVVAFPGVILIIILIEIIGQRRRRRIAPASPDTMETGSQLDLRAPLELGATDSMDELDFQFSGRKPKRTLPPLRTRHSNTSYVYREESAKPASTRSVQSVE